MVVFKFPENLGKWFSRTQKIGHGVSSSQKIWANGVFKSKENLGMWLSRRAVITIMKKIMFVRSGKFQKFWNCYVSDHTEILRLGFFDHNTEMLCKFQNFWGRGIGSYRNAVHVLEILGTVFSFITEESANSRTFGIAIYLIIQKFCGGPEILDQVFSIIPKCCTSSKISGDVALDPTEMLCTF
jgi:hypothetical protein